MTASEVREKLSALGIRADKGMGQNFLVNPLAAARIAGALGKRARSVLEIGPGLGSLTGALQRAGHIVTAIELSPELAAYTARNFSGVNAVQGDFLTAEPSCLPGFPFEAVASNLPYNISSQAVLRLCTEGYSHVETAVLMFQKELALRLCCLSGGRNYGRLPLMVWPWFHAEVLFDLAPMDFVPKPNVESSVVTLARRKKPPLSREQYAVYGRIVKAAFSSRRKKVINCLAGVFGKEAALVMLETCSVNPDLRAERITPLQFADLAVKASV
jgi:16S rRNA (adenine1518-N6/adenine1519-N6)-dimethyltransferase